MDSTPIVIDSDAELARARALVDRPMKTDDPADSPRLAAQTRLIAAHEEQNWLPRTPSAVESIGYLIGQHGLMLPPPVTKASVGRPGRATAA
ncbi:MAG: hypothetical protein WA709_32745 [Stellaceae bacterium]